jgi:hypothetical protein
MLYLRIERQLCGVATCGDVAAIAVVPGRYKRR